LGHQSLTIADEAGKTIKADARGGAGLTDHVWTLKEIARPLD
jgi:hypothetical protein